LLFALSVCFRRYCLTADALPLIAPTGDGDATDDQTILRLAAARIEKQRISGGVGRIYTQDPCRKPAP
jgi:hypothetical protein